jgi:hypothetical protein
VTRSVVGGLAVIVSILTGCAVPAGTRSSLPLTSPAIGRDAGSRARPLTELVNLDYSNGSITVFSVRSGRAKVTKRFTPARGLAQGLAVDKGGLIYTTVSGAASTPCAACVEVFTNEGKLTAQLAAPILPGAPGAPSLTDISVDDGRNMYVSDYGQQAVYFYSAAGKGGNAPTIVAQNSQNAASVLSTPDGKNVFVSGGCGFASVRPYTRVAWGQYTPGSCFGIGTIALIGGAADDTMNLLTPVDGVPGLVSVSSPTGGTVFTTPDQRYASISGIALNGDASVAYVADHHKECVYAFARPSLGWLSGVQPKVIATYRGFKNLDIIAVRP